MTKKKDYKITALEGIEAVRHVPGMYIGDLDSGSGLHHLLMEVIDNSVDEYMNGHCDKITIVLHKDGSASVSDNGRGIPVYYMKDKKKSALEVVFTALHAGGKFDKSNYKHSGGLHGVGVSVVNALSDKLRVIVHRDGKEYTMAFIKGKKVEDISEKPHKSKTGTTVRFAPDPTIFKKKVKFDPDMVKTKLRELSYLCKGLHIKFIDEIKNTIEEFDSSNGLKEFIYHLSNNNILGEPLIFNGNSDDILVDMAIQWIEGSEHEVCKCYTNNIPNPDGGTHMAGFRSGLTRTINSFISNSDLPKNLKVSLSGDDVREGLIAVVSIRHPTPKFNSQDKVKLVSDDARPVVEGVISEKLMNYLEQNPQMAKKIVVSCVNSYKAREAARKAREAVRSSGMKSGTILPGKLADCSSKNPEECELFIVEGQSAGGCFSGDTMIALPNGSDISFEDLVEDYRNGIEHYCYTIYNGNISTGKILNPRITRKNTKVLKLVLNNGEEIICTPDHKLMTNENKFVEAKNSFGINLRPFYKSVETKNYNPKVVKIVELDEKINVYDLEVPETHNFALSSGIFVHNSSKQARDRRFQAILPLRGKVLNVEKCEIQKMLKNEELMALITAIGVGIGRNLDLDNLRYNKIIIFTDADVDGAHIRTLLLTFFFRQLPHLIMNGNIYIARPPLYRINYRNHKYYLQDDNSLKSFIKEHNVKTEKDKFGNTKLKGISLQRFKGLGEMNADQLWETAMNPESRVISKIIIDNPLEADRTFSTLMGLSVGPRKEFLEDKAKEANIDI